MKQHQPLPLVALVGRPNVGKSTLFNRLVGRRTALVFDEPGVTRDRIFGEARMGDGRVRIVDTGGLTCAADDDVTQVGMREQTQLAIDEADLVLLVVDAHAGVTPADSEVAMLLRQAHKPTIVLANKVDVAARECLAAEFWQLGFEAVWPVSAEHGRGFEDLENDVQTRLALPKFVKVEDDQVPLPVKDESTLPEGAVSRIEWNGKPISVAVVGRPNAGKSSLINRLLREERLVASDVAGTTRDPIDTPLVRDGQDYLFIDTAGVRRKRSITRKLEQFAVVGAFNSIDKADVVLMVLDGATRPSDQDARIAAMAHDKGKGLILVVNKWDLAENPDWRTGYVEALRQQMPFADYAPMVRLSAKTGKNVETLFKHIIAAQQERHRRVGTGELNRFFREVVNSHPPPIRGGKRPQLYFVSQPLVRPPTFVFASSRADDLHFSYVRYLQNSLRRKYGFGGSPIWLKFRSHKKPRTAS